MAEYFFSRFGNDSNAGTLPGAAWRSAAKFNATTFSAGDIIYFAEGTTFTGQFSINDNGSSGNPITIKSYKDGSGKTGMPIFSNPDTIASNPRCLELLGDYIYVEGIDFRDAEEAAIEIFQTNDNNRVTKCRFENVGIGIRCKGNSNLIEANFCFNLKMSSNLGNSSDVGGIFVSLEKVTGQTNTGNTVRLNQVIGAKALSVQFNNDGGLVEVFKGCTNWTVERNFAKNCKGFMEVGGDNAVGDTISGGIVRNNVAVDCYGIVCYFNTKGGAFSVDIADHGIKFLGNTFYMYDRSASAFFFAGNWTGTPVDYQNNVWRGWTTFIATDGSTNLNTILLHTHNRYNRFSGTQTDLGTSYTLGTGETTGTPGFVNETGRDFRVTTTSALYHAGTATVDMTTDHAGVTRNSPPSIGAFEYVAAVDTTPSAGLVFAHTIEAVDDQSPYPNVRANRVKGGYHSYDRYHQMLSLPSTMREGGMVCYVKETDTEYRLDIDLVNWHPLAAVSEFHPIYSARVVDTKASGTQGGQPAFTSAGFYARTLNTVKYDDGIDCGISSGNLVIRRPGTYFFSAVGVANRTNRTQLRLYDVTKSRTIAVSPASYATSGNTMNVNTRIDRYMYVIDQQTTIRLDQYVQQLSTTGTPAGEDTFGSPDSTGEEEIYAQIQIELAR